MPDESEYEFMRMIIFFNFCLGLLTSFNNLYAKDKISIANIVDESCSYRKMDKDKACKEVNKKSIRNITFGAMMANSTESCSKIVEEKKGLNSCLIETCDKATTQLEDFKTCLSSVGASNSLVDSKKVLSCGLKGKNFSFCIKEIVDFQTSLDDLLECSEVSFAEYTQCLIKKRPSKNDPQTLSSHTKDL